jgi:hypothetical protein
VCECPSLRWELSFMLRPLYPQVGWVGPTAGLAAKEETRNLTNPPEIEFLFLGRIFWSRLFSKTKVSFMSIRQRVFKRSVSTNSEGLGFISRPGDCLFWLRSSWKLKSDGGILDLPQIGSLTLPSISFSIHYLVFLPFHVAYTEPAERR